MCALATHRNLLGAPDCGGGKVFVQGGMKTNIGCLQDPGRRLKLLIKRTQGRTAIACHIARGLQTLHAVTCGLHQAHPHQGLCACQIDLPHRKVEFLCQINGSQTIPTVGQKICHHRPSVWGCMAQAGR